SLRQLQWREHVQVALEHRVVAWRRLRRGLHGLGWHCVLPSPPLISPRSAVHHPQVSLRISCRNRSSALSWAVIPTGKRCRRLPASLPSSTSHSNHASCRLTARPTCSSSTPPARPVADSSASLPEPAGRPTSPGCSPARRRFPSSVFP